MTCGAIAMLSWPIDVRRAAAALGQQVAEPLARADQFDRAQQRVAAAERQPRLVEPAALDALHRERDRAAGADGVDAELVAALRRAQHRVGVADAAQRAEREQALVLDAHTARRRST